MQPKEKAREEVQKVKSLLDNMVTIIFHRFSAWSPSFRYLLFKHTIVLLGCCVCCSPLVCLVAFCRHCCRFFALLPFLTSVQHPAAQKPEFIQPSVPEDTKTSVNLFIYIFSSFLDLCYCCLCRGHNPPSFSVLYRNVSFIR